MPVRTLGARYATHLLTPVRVACTLTLELGVVVSLSSAVCVLHLLYLVPTQLVPYLLGFLALSTFSLVENL